MRIDFFPEPELQFGVDKHLDIRFGLMNYGPVDFAQLLAPKEIKVGIVGTNQTMEGVQRWLEKCRGEIPAKPSRQPNLFPRFPGFRPDVSFQSTLVMDSRLQRPVNSAKIEGLGSNPDKAAAIREAVELYYAELKYLEENTNADVLICAIPQIVVNIMESETGDDDLDDGDDEVGSRTTTPSQLNFHHIIKARGMALRIPIQLIRPSTYDETKRRRQKRNPEKVRRTQDEATRAWNLHTALYYKAKGVPWRLLRGAADYTACYVGISFYKTLDGSALLTSVAQVFNERGEGVVVRGGPAKISKDDKQVHLEESDANELLKNALARYKQEHKNFPARVVVHKSSTYTKAETNGFLSAAQEHNVEMVDLLTLHTTTTRLFRPATYPPLRGTFLSLEDRQHILYTRGSVDFFTTYPGMYVPRPLLIRCELSDQTPSYLAQEILGLTKMNWNNTQFDGSEPITMRAADQVGSILKYVCKDDYVAPSYRFYM